MGCSALRTSGSGRAEKRKPISDMPAAASSAAGGTTRPPRPAADATAPHDVHPLSLVMFSRAASVSLRLTKGLFQLNKTFIPAGGAQD
jgi:hypothetical protein